MQEVPWAIAVAPDPSDAGLIERFPDVGTDTEASACNACDDDAAKSPTVGYVRSRDDDDRSRSLAVINASNLILIPSRVVCASSASLFRR